MEEDCSGHSNAVYGRTLTLATKEQSSTAGSDWLSRQLLIL